MIGLILVLFMSFSSMASMILILWALGPILGN